jgi:pyrroloquinoline quinone biosynthesis protein D
MTVARLRTILTENSLPFLPPHVRLEFDHIRYAWVVLAPEKVFWPDEISVLILQKCDGTQTIKQIAAALAEDFSAPSEQIQGDILEFLQEWSDRLLVRDRASGTDAA